MVQRNVHTRGAKSNGGDGGDPPRIAKRRIFVSVLVAASAIGGTYLLAAGLEGFSHTWDRLRSGDPGWLVAGAVLELVSILGYAALFWSVVTSDSARIGWRASLQIPLAGIAALRLLATGGAGGFAIAAWALRQAGMSGRTIGTRMVAAFVMQYAIYMLALVVCGFGLWSGAFAGGGSFALTALPGVIAICVLAGFAPLALVRWPSGGPNGASAQSGGRLARWVARAGANQSSRRPDRLRRWLATAIATLQGGVRVAVTSFGKPKREVHLIGLIGAIAYWGFDVAVLWCSFRAFGAPPALAIVVMTYFLGTLAGLLPLPGGIGGVEGGMIGVFIAFGISPARAILAVLVYRLISFWLPTLPGIAGYLGLRRTVHGWEAARISGESGAPDSPTARPATVSGS